MDREARLAITILNRQENDTRIFDLSHESAVQIGRSAECDLVVACRQVSGKHLELSRSAEGWIARNLGSSNGTYCNNQRISEKTLRSGDVLDIGPCRLILTGDSLSVGFEGSVKSN